MIRFMLWTWLLWLGLSIAPVSASIIWSGTSDYPVISSGMGDIMWVNVDINRDSTWDFYFEGHDGFSFTPLNGNAGVASNGKYTPLNMGVLIDAEISYDWSADSQGLGWASGTIWEPENVLNKYLGIAFVVDEQTHYGWFQLSHYPAKMALPGEYQSSSTLIIHDFAWETEPDTPIVAGAIPEPSSVLLAVIGAMSVWVLRRQNRASKPWKE